MGTGLILKSRYRYILSLSFGFKELVKTSVVEPVFVFVSIKSCSQLWFKLRYCLSYLRFIIYVSAVYISGYAILQPSPNLFILS